MYDLINIFDTFLPQLLLYPNPTDPLNNDAASLQLKSEEQYTQKIKEYVGLYASSHLPQLSQKKCVTPASDDAKSCMMIIEEEKNAGAAANLGTNHSSEGKLKKAKRECGDDDGFSDSSADEIKQHESELSETSDIEMLEIEDDDDNEGGAVAEVEY